MSAATKVRVIHSSTFSSAHVRNSDSARAQSPAEVSQSAVRSADWTHSAGARDGSGRRASARSSCAAPARSLPDWASTFGASDVFQAQVVDESHARLQARFTYGQCLVVPSAAGELVGDESAV